MRLQRFLAQAGVAARRKAETLIERGAVAVNGKIVRVLGTKVDPERDHVTVDGEAVQPDDYLYIVLNKPKACITSVSDPQGRRTVMEYVPGLPASVVPVGRLDFYSEGVLLLTNDGELAAALTSPRTHVEKTYHVKIKGRLTSEDAEALESGVRIGPHTVTRPAKVDRLRSQSRHDWLVISLTEGKSRQIHRMLEALGHEVLKLQRVAFGSITFHGLRVGDARELTQAEVDELRELAGLRRGGSAVSRGKWRVRREETEVARRARDRARTLPTPNPTPGGSRKGSAALRARQAELAEAAPPRPPRASAAGAPGPRAVAKPGPKAQRSRKPGAAGSGRAAGGSARKPSGSQRPTSGMTRKHSGSQRPAAGKPGKATGSQRSAAGKPGRATGSQRSAAGKPGRATGGSRDAGSTPRRGPGGARPAKSPRVGAGGRPAKPTRSRAGAKAPGPRRKGKPARR